MKVKLSDILEAFEFMNDEISYYLNRNTGQVIMLSSDLIAHVENGEEFDAMDQWEEDMVIAAREIFVNDNPDYLYLPDSFQINEYNIMENFVDNVDDEKSAAILAISLKGRGAFRRFKDSLYPLKLEDKWFAFRVQELKEIAIEWCDEKNISYVNDIDKI